MADDVEKYGSPALALTITGNHGGGFSWEIRMQALDVAASRILDYRASGSALIEDISPPIFAVEVRDEGREVWTALPVAHRVEVREAIVALLSNALSSMKSVSSV